MRKTTTSPAVLLGALLGACLCAFPLSAAWAVPAAGGAISFGGTTGVMPAGGSTGGSTAGGVPTVTAFEVGLPVGLDVPIWNFSVSGSGISGYLITTSPDQPTASDPNWLPQLPKSFRLPGPGGYILYPWAKNGEGVSPLSAFLAKVAACALNIPVSSTADAGPGSLRQALVDICPKGTIGLAPGLNITLQSTLEVNKEVTILGQPSTDMPTLSGNDTVQIMKANSFLSLRDIKFVHGKAGQNDRAGGLEAWAGANITNVFFDSNEGLAAGALYFYAYGPMGSKVQNCEFTNNKGTNSGGALTADMDPVVAATRDPFSVPQELLIDGCRFIGNTGWCGGAISNIANLGIKDSRIEGNHSGQDGGGLCNTGNALTQISVTQFTGNTAAANGGGLFNGSNGIILSLSCSFANNTAGLDGGGMYHQGGGVAWISASSFSINQAQGLGGALLSGATLLLTNSTLYGNSAGLGGGLFYLDAGFTQVINDTIVSNTGGGVVRGGQTHSLMANTILAGNSPDCGVDVQSQPTHGLHATAINLSDDETCSDASLTNDLKLGVFGSHGGPTNSIPLLAGSSAIDAGDTSLCGGLVSNLDQRGVARPPTHCSMGAYEPLARIDVLADFGTSLQPIPMGGSVDFGTVAVGAPRTVTFYVANPLADTGEGAGKLVLQEPITVPGGFTLARSFGVTSVVQPNSTTFQVTMNADAPGNPSGLLSFNNDVAGANPFSFTIHGKVGCAAGQYFNGTSNTCVACSTCPTGQKEDPATACSGTTSQDHTCKACTPCAANQFADVACSTYADNHCTACTTTDCPSGFFRSAECSATADRVCSRCSGGCPYGYVTVASCTPTSDRVCQPSGLVDPPPSTPANADVDAGADGSVAAPGTEPDAMAAPDAQVAVDTFVATDTKPDTQNAPDTRPSGQPETGTIQPSGDAQARPDTQVVIGGEKDAQADVIAIEPDALALDTAGTDSAVAVVDARTGDAAKDSATPDTNPDTLAVVQPDARISDGPAADVSGGKKKDETGCKCNLSGRGSQSSGGLALLLIGLALAVRSRRRK